MLRFCKVKLMGLAATKQGPRLVFSVHVMHDGKLKGVHVRSAPYPITEEDLIDRVYRDYPFEEYAIQYMLDIPLAVEVPDAWEWD